MHVFVFAVEADDALQWHILIAFQSRNVRSLFFNLCIVHSYLSHARVFPFISFFPFLNCPSNDNRIYKIAADKWRENFSTESEMLSHLFTYSWKCFTLTYSLKKDRLFAASQINFNELVALSHRFPCTDYYAKVKVNVSFTQNDIIVIYWKLWVVPLNVCLIKR